MRQLQHQIISFSEVTYLQEKFQHLFALQESLEHPFKFTSALCIQWLQNKPSGFHITNTSELEKLSRVLYLSSGHSAGDLSPVGAHDGSVSSDDSQRSGQSVVASKSTYTPETMTK